MTMSMSAEEILEIASSLGIGIDADQQAKLSPVLQSLHRAVLGAFLDGDPGPDTGWLAHQAEERSLNPARAITKLAESDLVHVDGATVTVAYPFSGTRTAHRVRLASGRSVWAMCAIDALGIPAMTGQDATVFSSDPDTGAPVRVEFHDGCWRWTPKDAVVVVGFSGACSTSAQAVCPQIDFHTDHHCAERHLLATPGLVGLTVDQDTAVALAERIFGRVLDG